MVSSLYGCVDAWLADDGVVRDRENGVDIPRISCTVVRASIRAGVVRVWSLLLPGSEPCGCWRCGAVLGLVFVLGPAWEP